MFKGLDKDFFSSSGKMIEGVLVFVLLRAERRSRPFFSPIS
jgi:hypothetical protein